MRPHFLPRTPMKARRSILGGLLVRFGFARRPVSTAEVSGRSSVVRLADVDPRAASLMLKRDALSKRHAAGAKAAHDALTTHVHKVLAGGVRHV